jgi:hypothetical protein
MQPQLREIIKKKQKTKKAINFNCDTFSINQNRKIKERKK